MTTGDVPRIGGPADHSSIPLPEGLVGPPPLRLSDTVRASDTSTSIVLHVGVEDQMSRGAVDLDQHLGITYARHTLPDGTPLELRLDLLVPRTGSPVPLVVYLPGGGFVLSMRENAFERRAFLAEAGFAVASIEYRTTLHGATYRDGIADVRSAVRHLRAHAAEWGLETADIGVWGESAGGYLAAMTGVTNGTNEFDFGEHLELSSDVQAVVDMFGGSDLAAHADDFDEQTQEFFRQPENSLAWYVYGRGSGTSFADDPAGAAEANPVSHLSDRTPPFLLFHGTADLLIAPSQTLILHEALLSAGLDSTRYVLVGAKHGDMGFLGDPDAVLPWTSREVVGYLTEFLRARLVK